MGKNRIPGIVVGLVAIGVSVAQGQEEAKKQPVKFQITGLFSPGRVDDLREVMKRLPDVELVSVDFKNAEAAFAFDAAKAFPGVKPDQIFDRLDNRIRTSSSSTFGVRPLRAMPLEKCMLVEISVVGLDCKGCSLATYESIYKLEGVERATASFKEGRVTAHIDPAKIDRAALEAALKKRNVQLAVPQ